MGFPIPNRTAFLTEKIYIKKVTAKSITDVDEFLVKEIEERCGHSRCPDTYPRPSRQISGCR